MKKNLKLIIGIVLISIPFVIFFCGMWHKDGLLIALKVWVASLFLTGMIGLGAYLIATKISE